MRRTVRTTLLLAASGVALALAGCSPGDPDPSPSGTGEPTASPSASPSPSATPQPSPTQTSGGDDIALPESCESIYSPDMLARFQQHAPPLNDPGVTMLATEVVEGLEILETAPTIRCTWGMPSDWGLATNVTIVDAQQRDTLADALPQNGFACEDAAVQTTCARSSDSEVGEVHVLRGNAWIATHWIGIDAEGEYTEDIVATLWG